MASASNSLKPTEPTTKMIPGDSRKVCVLDDNRQIDRVVKGEWTMLKVLPESDLPRGIYQLGEATKVSNGKDASFTGQVLFGGSRAIYQLSGKGVVEHLHLAFAELEAKGRKVVDDRSYITAYANDKGAASSAQTASVAQPRVTSKGHGASM